MAFRILTAETITCPTRESIEAFALNLNALGGIEGERHFSSTRLQRIKDSVLDGEIRPFDWAVAQLTTPTTHDKKRVNGQHSGTMFLELTEEEWPRVPFPIYVHYTEYSCDTDEDRLILFEQFDQRWSSRSEADIMGVHLAAEPALIGRIQPEVALALTAGLRWYQQKVGGLTSTRGIIAEMTETEKRRQQERSKVNMLHTDDARITDFLQYGGTFLEKSKSREMLKAPVVGAMFHTTQDNSKQQDFWKDVALGKAKLEGGSIAYKLAEFLEEYRRNDHASWPPEILRKLRGQKKVTTLDAFATCLRACLFVDTGKVMGDVFVMAQRQSAKDLVTSYYPRTMRPNYLEQSAAD